MPILSPPCGTGYTPRSCTNDLKDIIEDHLEELIGVYDERFGRTYGPLHPRVRDLMEAYVRCGDPHFGFLRLRCCNPECEAKHELILPFSCKGRGLCPSCGQKRALLWAERMVEEVLPHVPYAGVVFTIPKMLRGHFLWERKLYGDLSRAAYEATRKFFAAQFPTLIDAVPAMVVSPHSWGNLLHHHPHAHGLTSLGVFTRDGVFHAAPEDLDFAPLEEIFREEVFSFMRKREKITEERERLLRSWRNSGFQVSAARRFRTEDREGLESLLQYMERAPVSLERLEYREDGKALYRGRFNPSLGVDHRLTSGPEFLAMLVPHIALRYECRIRCYGAISTTSRQQLGWIKMDENSEAPEDVVVAEEDESGFVKLRKRNWARLIAKVYLEDPEVCPSCGKKMKVLAAMTSPHQDAVIERILRARGQWDPPWKRERRARGPPRQLEIVFSSSSSSSSSPQDELSQPGASEEEYSQARPQTEDEFSQVAHGSDEEL